MDLPTPTRPGLILSIFAAAGLTGVALLSAWQSTPRETVAPLPALAAKLDATSVSGISSGAYMAGQFEFAHAKIVVGAAIIAGGPYGCSESVFAGAVPAPGAAWLNLSKAINGCMKDMLRAWGAANADDLAEKAKKRADKGDIDPIADVASDRIYLFSGKEDRTVAPSIVAAAAEFYAKLGASPQNMKLADDVPGRARVRNRQRRRRVRTLREAARRRLRLRSGGRSAQTHLRPVEAAIERAAGRLRRLRSKAFQTGSGT